MNKAILVYPLALGLYLPALLTNYLGGVSNGFWDFYESTFVLIALIDFIPLMTALLLLKSQSLFFGLGFAVTGSWMLILAMPDIFMSYLPIVDQAYFADYQAWWFGDVSSFCLFLNLVFFLILWVQNWAERVGTGNALGI